MEMEELRAYSFGAINDSLIGEKVVSCFHPTNEAEIIVDTSPVGLGRLLVQRGRIIKHANRDSSYIVQNQMFSERHFWCHHVNKCRAKRGNWSELVPMWKSPRYHVNTPQPAWPTKKTGEYQDCILRRICS